MATSEQPTRVRSRRPRPRRGEHPRELPPRLAEGLELMGEYEGSGFKQAPYIARRADGQTIQLTHLLHLVAEAADGRRDHEAMAAVVTERLGRGVSADNIRFLVEKKLRPLGLLAAADGSGPELPKPDPLLALKFRTALVPEGVTRALTTVFRPLFWPPVVVVVVLAFLAATGWLFFVHGVGQGLRGLIYNPVYLLVLFGGIVLGTAFHEVGHATALRYGGGRPGVMGAGIYIVWPAFYTDVTDAYRLGRTARLRTDLGGIYFNAIVAVLAVGAHLVTGWEVILLLAVAQTFAMVQQLMPFLRLDGYYILSDLTGIPDMLTRLRPVLRSVVPGREQDERVAELKPWARRVITGYVLLLVPVLAVLFGVMIVHAPRAFATAYDSFFVQTGRIGDALDAGSVVSAAGGGLQLVFLVLPLAGIVLTTGRIGRRGLSSAWRATADRPSARGALVTGGVAAVALAAWTWWPNGDYRPIQPTERGTLLTAVSNLRAIPSGRPGLTVERERELGGAPFRSGAAGAAVQDERSERGGEERTREEDPQSRGQTTTTRSTPTTPTTPTTPGTPPAQTTPTPASAPGGEATTTPAPATPTTPATTTTTAPPTTTTPTETTP